MYELDSPEILSDGGEGVINEKIMKPGDKREIEQRQQNEWMYLRISESVCDSDTILVKKRKLSTGIGLYQMHSLKSSGIKNITSPSLAWRKLPKRQKQVLYY